MGIAFFKKIGLCNSLLSIEKISLLYSLITSMIIFCLFNRLENPFVMLTDRILTLAIMFLLVFINKYWPVKLTYFARIVFQIALLSYWYPDTYELNRALPNLDHVFASCEQFLFGFQPAILFHKILPYKFASEAFNLGYFSYYPMIATVTFFFFIKRYKSFERFAFILIGSFFLFYFLYIFIPVAGPQYYFPAIGLENVRTGNFISLGNYFNTHQELLAAPGASDGLFYKLVEYSQQSGERPTAAFPSSHVGVSSILMILSWKESKLLFYILLPFYFLLCCATVYIQAHYAIDAIFGLLFGIFFYNITSKVFKTYFKPIKV